MNVKRSETTGNVYVAEWDGVSPVIVKQNRILLFVATGPEHSGYLKRLGVVKEAAVSSSVRGWHWVHVPKSEEVPVPGIYIAIPYTKERVQCCHHHNESPIDFLRRATGLDIKEEDECPHLHLFHD